MRYASDGPAICGLLHASDGGESSDYFFFFVGSFLRLVFAKSRSCFSLIDFAICLEAPLSEDFERSPRFAANAAPAAFCCFFDLAGILKTTPLKRFTDGERRNFMKPSALRGAK